MFFRRSTSKEILYKKKIVVAIVLSLTVKPGYAVLNFVEFILEKPSYHVALSKSILFDYSEVKKNPDKNPG
jgi:hypothetical protein